MSTADAYNNHTDPSAAESAKRLLSNSECYRFWKHGYVVLKNFANLSETTELKIAARKELASALDPLEYEADVGYPWAPTSRFASGGSTIRRLRNAFERHESFRKWATSASLVAAVTRLIGESISLTLAHHNCIMTKHPHYGSQTRWHRDLRHWSFSKPSLVIAWLALGDENEQNGGLRVIPGSHRTIISPSQLDDDKFLAESHSQNAELLASARGVSLETGDLLLFHSLLFHAAGTNLSDEVKLSLAFAYFGNSNRPSPGSSSESCFKLS
jgi:phytanoyl-CoA hydroxylase